MFGEKMAVGRFVTLAVVGAAALAAQAFPEIPMESAKALGVTKGKSFVSGIVFVNGKYLPPPYVVSRWGTGLRINGQPVSGQVIDWAEFVRTQAGAKVNRTVEPTTPEPVVLAPEPGSAEDDSDSSLDDLFDDGPKVKKSARKSGSAPLSVAKAPVKPKETVTYSFDGAFTPNARTKQLLNSINASRSEIDRTLRLGGFMCFGDGYARIVGDSRTAERLLDTVPDLMQKCGSARELYAAVRAAGMVYLTERFCEDLFRNRIDYRVLRERREAMKRDKAWSSALGSPSASF